MSTTQQSQVSSSAQAPVCKNVVDTLVGLGNSWAAFGLKVGKAALVTSAETLGKTAETLDALAAAFAKKAADKADAADKAAAENKDPAAAEPPAAASA